MGRRLLYRRRLLLASSAREEVAQTLARQQVRLRRRRRPRRQAGAQVKRAKENRELELVQESPGRNKRAERLEDHDGAHQQLESEGSQQCHLLRKGPKPSLRSQRLGCKLRRDRKQHYPVEKQSGGL